MKRLIDLHPEWRENPPGNRYISLDCPTCAPELKCRITVACDNTIFTDGTWISVGGPGFETITLSPSLQHHCDTSPHFFIRNGEIQIV